VESVRQNVKKEATYELPDRQPHDFAVMSAVASIIFPPEADMRIVDLDEAAVANGDAVSVAGEIGKDLLWAGKRALGVDHPCDRRSPGKENGNVT